MENIIDSIYQDIEDIKEVLMRSEEISSLSDSNNYFTKLMILSAASYFEDEIQEILRKYIKRYSRNEIIFNFANNKGICRKYHTFFTWDRKNANDFFGLFGKEFKDNMCKKVKNNEKLDEAIKCFLEIGHMRNILVHSNFAVYNELNKTLEEIKDLFDTAKYFIEYLKNEVFIL